jgi:hypothetical protein
MVLLTSSACGPQLQVVADTSIADDVLSLITHLDVYGAGVVSTKQQIAVGDALATKRSVNVPLTLKPGQGASTLQVLATDAEGKPLAFGQGTGDDKKISISIPPPSAELSTDQPASETEWPNGPQVLGQPSAPLTIMLSNGPTVPVDGLSVTASDQLEMVSNGCAPANFLLPGSSCSLTVRANPTQLGWWGATVDVSAWGGASANASFRIFTVPAGSIAAEPGAIAFDAVLAGTATEPSPIRIKNAAAVSSGPLSVSLSGADALSYAITTDACSGKDLAPGAVCEVSVAAQPMTVGAHTATLVVASIAAGTTDCQLGPGLGSRSAGRGELRVEDAERWRPRAGTHPGEKHRRPAQWSDLDHVFGKPGFLGRAR